MCVPQTALVKSMCEAAILNPDRAHLITRLCSDLEQSSPRGAEVRGLPNPSRVSSVRIFFLVSWGVINMTSVCDPLCPLLHCPCSSSADWCWRRFRRSLKVAHHTGVLAIFRCCWVEAPWLQGIWREKFAVCGTDSEPVTSFCVVL